MKDKLTIVIPEHNRPKRLKRILYFYLENGFNNIVVPDSSNKEFEYLSEFKDKIIYRHYPRKHLVEKILAIKDNVKTPYVILCAEDDYMMPSALNKIINFLESNNDYISAQGYWLQFWPKQGNRLRYQYPQVTKENSLLSDDPRTRTISLFEHYYQFYYVVMRKELFFTSYETMVTNGKLRLENLCLVEMWQAAYCAFKGKHAVLPVFYAMREYISSSAGHKVPSYRALKNNNQETAQVIFFESLFERLIGVDGFNDLLVAYQCFGKWWEAACTQNRLQSIINKLDNKIFNHTLQQRRTINKIKNSVQDIKMMQRDLQTALDNLNKFHTFVYGS